MKIKTSELLDGALNWAVAKALQLPIELHQGCVFVDGDPFMPESFWNQGGPIIEREGIALYLYGGSEWNAHVGVKESTGPTPLIAAMRCYVASKRGDEVDVPDNFVWDDLIYEKDGEE